MDPLASLYPGASPYVYVLNNPLNMTDPSGMSAKCETCADDEEYDFFRKSPNNYNYDEGTGEVTREGGELAEARVVRPRANQEAQNNTKVTLLDYSKLEYGSKESDGEWSYSQTSGSSIYGSAEKALLKMPDADVKEDPIETFSMGGGPGVSGKPLSDAKKWNLLSKIIQAMVGGSPITNEKGKVDNSSEIVPSYTFHTSYTQMNNFKTYQISRNGGKDSAIFHEHLKKMDIKLDSITKN